jgi:hypothetical protein
MENIMKVVTLIPLAIGLLIAVKLVQSEENRLFSPTMSYNNMLKVEKAGNPFQGTYELNSLLFMKITSMVDDIEIEKLTLNRGNCSKFGLINDGKKATLPKRLKYADSFYVVTSIEIEGCRPILETEIDTNLGRIVTSPQW